MEHIYVDAEFDAIKIQGKYYQMVVSFGAVLCKGDEVYTFYSLVKPKNFRRLSSVVKKMTHLKNEEIRNASSFPVILEAFQNWLSLYVEDRYAVYSFGPDDRRTFLQECERYKISNTLFDPMIDLQKELSKNVTYHGQILSPTLSLDDLKFAYEIAGAVEHNALTDANDLMLIHKASLIRKPNEEAIGQIVARKQAKAEESAKKQQEKLFRIMKERFSIYRCLQCKIKLYPEVVEQFLLWQERDPSFRIYIKKDGILVDDEFFLKHEVTIHMKVRIDEKVPSVSFDIFDEEKKISKKYLLQYRNASMVETILKRMLANVSG